MIQTIKSKDEDLIVQTSHDGQTLHAGALQDYQVNHIQTQRNLDHARAQNDPLSVGASQPSSERKTKNKQHLPESPPSAQQPIRPF